ncbi:MAG: Ig-like domain-containing protein [Myxococcaceae bacterium]
MRTLFVAAVAVVSAGASGCLEPAAPLLEFRDTKPPMFVEVDPAADSVLSTTPEIRVTFSEPMDERTVRPGILLLQDNTGVPVVVTVPEDNRIPDAVEQVEIPWTVLIVPEAPLPAGASFRLVLDSVLTDTEGNPLAGPDGGTVPIAIPYRT